MDNSKGHALRQFYVAVSSAENKLVRWRGGRIGGSGLGTPARLPPPPPRRNLPTPAWRLPLP